MSLRPDDERTGRPGRSHSRTRDHSSTRERSRSRDVRFEEPSRSHPPSTSNRESRSSDHPESRSDAPRQPPSRSKGLSALLSTGDDSDSDESRADRHSPTRPNGSHSVAGKPQRNDRAPSPARPSNPARKQTQPTPYPSDDTMMPMSPSFDLNSPVTMSSALSENSSSHRQKTLEKDYFEAKSQYAGPAQKDNVSPPPSSSSKSHKRGVSFGDEVEGREDKPSKPPPSPKSRPSTLSIDTKNGDRAPSPGLTPRMDRLSVGGKEPGQVAGKAPPGSPLLEAYRGTYQSMPPMPSPMMMADTDVDDLPPLSPLTANEAESPGRTKSDAKPKKRVKLYDAEGDAESIAKALNRQEIDPTPLIEILPDLTHDQLLALQNAYKKIVKIGGKGVNISKQMKASTTGNFGKACFVTSLGRWESEGYWANFWYQSHTSSRELLIEALMGRSNADIREIKANFSDKRYNDSLSRCMEKELKPDKFLMAVLLVLEAHRQEETDTWPTEYRNRDVETLHRAIKSREGGETAILEIVVRRSDNHLRDVLKTYERTHQSNFARDALKKSNNLVGEVIAHILNGVINRPARDSMLLRHAIDDITEKNREVELRYELLMSRLIRLHWDRMHLARVKREYKNKNGSDLERDIRSAARGDFREFCLRLCQT